MVLLPGMHGLREKYWCVNRQTGECQGIYAWQRAADAHAYAGAVALRVITGRSLPGSVSIGSPASPRMNTGHFVRPLRLWENSEVTSQ
jgi:hypothetical protein